MDIKLEYIIINEFFYEDFDHILLKFYFLVIAKFLVLVDVHCTPVHSRLYPYVSIERDNNTIFENS